MGVLAGITAFTAPDGLYESTWNINDTSLLFMKRKISFEYHRSNSKEGPVKIEVEEKPENVQ